MQNVLQGFGYYTGCVDATFGTNTFNGTKLFQATFDLAADGVVGQATWKTMRSQLTWYAGSFPNLYYGVAPDMNTPRFHSYTDDNTHWYTNNGTGCGPLGNWKQMVL